MTSDAGALLLGRTARALRLQIDRFARCFVDHRAPELIEHEVATLVGQRVYGIALGYEDLVDHDQLRHDPVLAALGGKLEARRTGCAALAGKSTLNRLELSRAEPSRYHKIGHDGAAIERLFVDLFLEAHAGAPSEITLDLDATDDPVHGEQEGRFFHGAIMAATATCRCTYSAAAIFSAAKLRPANIDGSAGAREEVESGSSARSAPAGPRCGSSCRPISGFAREALMAWCEDNGVHYLFGLARNARLVSQIEAELAEASVRECRHRATGAPLQGLPVDDAPELEPTPAASSVRPNGPRAKPIPASS